MRGKSFSWRYSGLIVLEREEASPEHEEEKKTIERKWKLLLHNLHERI